MFRVDRVWYQLVRNPVARLLLLCGMVPLFPTVTLAQLTPAAPSRVGQVSPPVRVYPSWRAVDKRTEQGFKPKIRQRRQFATKSAQPMGSPPQFFDTPDNFGSPELIRPTINGGTFVAAADFNGDGKPDLAVLEYSVCKPYGDGCEVLSILLGNGDGTFHAGAEYGILLGSHQFPSSIAIGDFNGDGRPDIAIAISDVYSSSRISVFLGNGDGTFQSQNYSLTAVVVIAAAGDFNGDGKSDLVVSGGSGSGVWLGKDDGTFQIQPDQDFPQDLSLVSSIPIVTGDFNGDGKTDAAVLYGGVGSCTVKLLFGNGDGTFRALVALPYSLTNALSIAVASLRGNGKADLIVGTDTSIEILLGNGDGTFQAPMDYGTVGADGGSPSVADFNGDGRLDLAFSNSGHMVGVLLGNGDGTFGVERLFGTSGGGDVIAADFNGDGKLDLVVGDNMLLGNGDGTFQARLDYAVQGGVSATTFGDFNRDGNLDLAVANLCGVDPQCAAGTVSILSGNGNGTFDPPVSYATGAGASAIAAGDFNKDGKLDLVTANYQSLSGGNGSNSLGISVLLGNGDGTFQTHTDYPGGEASNLGYSPASVAVADLNADGNLDIVATGMGIGAVVWIGNGDGTFQAGVKYSNTGGDSSALAVGDFNGDGKPDLAVTNGAQVVGYNNYGSPVMTCRGSTVGVLLGHGDGTFGAPQTYGTGFDPESVAVGDFNADGKLDMVVISADSKNDCTGNSGFSILLGNGDGSFQVHNYPLIEPSAPKPVAVGDFNLDGKLDIVVGVDRIPYEFGVSAMVGLLLGNGDGTFQPQTTYATGVAVSTVAVGDFNNDGLPDLATSNAASGTVSLLRNIQAPDFSVRTSPVNPLSPGQSTSSSVEVRSIAGFKNPAALSCSVSPALAKAPTCLLSPTSVQPAANGLAISTLTINTTATVGALDRPSAGQDKRTHYALWLSISGLAFGTVCMSRVNKGKLVVLLASAMVATVLLQSACGGGSGSGSGAGAGGGGSAGTAAGSYTVTVTATSGSLSRNTTLTVIVQ